jgi:hypothetical protein
MSPPLSLDNGLTIRVSTVPYEAPLDDADHPHAIASLAGIIGQSIGCQSVSPWSVRAASTAIRSADAAPMAISSGGSPAVLEPQIPCTCDKDDAVQPKKRAEVNNDMKGCA